MTIDSTLPNLELPIAPAPVTPAGLWLVREHGPDGVTQTSLVRAYKSGSAVKAVTGKRFSAERATPNEVADILTSGGSIIDGTPAE